MCGTGIGGAVVIDRKIHYGANLYGGEFGCMVMRDETGRLSTFSAQASTMSFVRKLQKQYPEQEWNGKKVFEEAAGGNQACIQAIDRLRTQWEPALLLLISMSAPFGMMRI